MGSGGGSPDRSVGLDLRGGPTRAGPGAGSGSLLMYGGTRSRQSGQLDSSQGVLVRSRGPPKCREPDLFFPDDRTCSTSNREGREDVGTWVTDGRTSKGPDDAG